MAPPVALVRFVGGPLDGQRRRFELLVDSDGRPHARLVRRDPSSATDYVYRLAVGPTREGDWLFVLAAEEPHGAKDHA